MGSVALPKEGRLQVCYNNVLPCCTSLISLFEHTPINNLIVNEYFVLARNIQRDNQSRVESKEKLLT